MYSDTHFHFKKLCEDSVEEGSQILRQLNDYSPLFEMDIGTKPGDLEERSGFIKECLDALTDEERKKACEYIYFSAGLWPGPDEIRERESCVKKLREDIECFTKGSVFNNRLVAIGECGLDHHWNVNGPDGRDEADFNDDLLRGEREMFMMQIELAKDMNLPVIVHSRDAYSDTLSCIDEAGYHNGIIHCYSYGIDEAREFLNRGWYIALGGAVTYTKKSKMELMHQLLTFIPDDRILLETDAPYLSPVPLRGQKNTPLNICHTYEFIAGHRGVSVEKLSADVDENVRRLFKLI
ncbi:MAG: TatD family hydrolase [Treponema sp.]|nr:TatD family hydrolase [Treponema sp.]